MPDHTFILNIKLYSESNIKNIFNQPHRRYNPLKGEWVLISPHRTQRPWLGKQESVQRKISEYEPDCYLCPGNVRANGETNPQYTSTFVFQNDYSALLPETDEGYFEMEKFMVAEKVNGLCKVICFSPKHNITLPEMSVGEISEVIKLWIAECRVMFEKYKWVQIFENKGEVMGASNPHPHCQIWASSFLPNELLEEDKNQNNYLQTNKTVLLSDYRNFEILKNERIIIQNERWISLVPYWAIWPYETMILPRKDIKSILELSEEDVKYLAEILKGHLIKYDNLFNVPFPYSMGFHFVPPGYDNSGWLLHIHFYPPLLRSATVKKFMVGYEMLAESQRDITPEQAALRLRELPEIHYLQATQTSGTNNA